MTETKSVWRCIDVRTDHDEKEGTDAITLAFKSDGHLYAVTVAARANVMASELVNALRAAAAQLINAAGGDMSSVGAQTLGEAAMDTGDQRAN
jgi:hypothetical protein